MEKRDPDLFDRVMRDISASQKDARTDGSPHAQQYPAHISPFTPKQEALVQEWIDQVVADYRKEIEAKEKSKSRFGNRIIFGFALATTLGAVYILGRDELRKIEWNSPPPMLEEMAASDLLREGDPQMLLLEYDETKLTVPLSHYLDYKRRNHRPLESEGYARFITPNDPYIQELARHLTQGFDSEPGRVDEILRFVQQHAYISDPVEHQEYAKYPIETLVERNGDCEDVSILAASLLLAASQDVVMLLYAGPLRMDEDGLPDREGHMNLAIAGDYSGTHVAVDGRNYYIVELTSEGWTIGNAPPNFTNYEIQAIRSR